MDPDSTPRKSDSIAECLECVDPDNAPFNRYKFYDANMPQSESTDNRWCDQHGCCGGWTDSPENIVIKSTVEECTAFGEDNEDAMIVAAHEAVHESLPSQGCCVIPGGSG